MPYIDWGVNLPKQGGSFTRLKKTGERLQFRIIGKPFVEGNHFFLVDGSWDIQPCPRINNQETCVHCEKMFKALKAIPHTDNATEYRKLADEAKKTVPGCDPGITFNFPVINRETEAFTVFKATPGIRGKIEAEYALGTKVMDVDFVAVNTGKHGKDKYAVSRVDSAETGSLTVKEQEIRDSFNPTEFAASISGSPDDEGGVAFEANSETLTGEIDEEPNV